MKRWVKAVLIAGGVMVADVIALILATRAFLPAKPPQWATAPFFWSLAWPVPVFTHVFPQPASSTDHGPTFFAVAASGLLDATLLTCLVFWIMKRRAATTAAT